MASCFNCEVCVSVPHLYSDGAPEGWRAVLTEVCVFVFQFHTYIVMEHLKGGELF